MNEKTTKLQEIAAVAAARRAKTKNHRVVYFFITKNLFK